MRPRKYVLYYILLWYGVIDTNTPTVKKQLWKMKVSEPNEYSING